MNFIEYSEGDLINVKSLDNEHREIFNYINKLHAYLSSNNFGEFVKELKDFQQLVEKHFSEENNLMLTHKDPGYFSHHYEHLKMSRKIITGLNEAKNRSNNITIEFVESLKRWFKNHLILKDKKLGKFLNSKGIF